MITVKNKTYLSVPETAKLIGRSNQFVYQFHKKMNWNAYKYGQSLLFEKEDIEKWLESQLSAV